MVNIRIDSNERGQKCFSFMTISYILCLNENKETGEIYMK